MNETDPDAIILDGPLEKPDEAAPGSILAELRARRDEIAQERVVDLEVPGYGGELFVTCKPISFVTLKRIATRMEKSTSEEKELHAAADTLIAACQAIKVRGEKGLQSIDPRGDTVRFDKRLAELLGFEADSARDVVFGLFPSSEESEENSSYTGLLTLCARFNEWQADASIDIDEDFREP